MVPADLAVFDLSSLAYTGALNDPIAALIFCGMDSRAEMVVVNGQIVVKEKQLVRVDEQKIIEGANRASEQLLTDSGVIG